MPPRGEQHTAASLSHDFLSARVSLTGISFGMLIFCENVRQKAVVGEFLRFMGLGHDVVVVGG